MDKQPTAKILTPLVDLSFMRSRIQDRLDKLTYERDIYPRIFQNSVDCIDPKIETKCQMTRQILPTFNNISNIIIRTALSYNDGPNTLFKMEESLFSDYLTKQNKMILCWEYNEETDILECLHCYPPLPQYLLKVTEDPFKMVGQLLSSRQLLLFVVYNQLRFIDRLLPNLLKQTQQQSHQSIFKTWPNTSRHVICKSIQQISFDLDDTLPIKLHHHWRLSLFVRRLSDYKVASLGFFNSNHSWFHRSELRSQWISHFKHDKEIFFHILFPCVSLKSQQTLSIEFENNDEGYFVFKDSISQTHDLAPSVCNNKEYKMFTFPIHVDLIEKIKVIRVIWNE